jgi:hypothetical protein
MISPIENVDSENEKKSENETAIMTVAVSQRQEDRC